MLVVSRGPGTDLKQTKKIKANATRANEIRSLKLMSAALIIQSYMDIDILEGRAHLTLYQSQYLISNCRFVDAKLLPLILTALIGG
jgi:hypothetical protein